MAMKDGGPAFPLPETERSHGNYGMSLRDWFISQSIAASASIFMDAAKSGAMPREMQENPNGFIAACAVEIADAIMSERNK